MQYPVSATGSSGGKPLLVLSPIPDQDHPDTMNQVVWSLMYILQSQSISGTNFDPTVAESYQKLALAIQSMINTSVNNLAAKLVPIGSVIWCPSRQTIPANYTPGDGQIALRTDYPEITSILNYLPNLSESYWVATKFNRGRYSMGDGSTTFRFPDYNGIYSTDVALFLRGDGHGTGDGVGKVQGDAIRNITGNVGSVRGDTLGGGSTGAFLQTVSAGDFASGGAPLAESTFDASRVVPTDNENRPWCVSGVWCIRTDGVPYSPLPP